MLALRIELLTGRYVATCYHDRGVAEWPPHPARVFSALAAAHFSAVVDDAADASAASAAEAAALAWLAALPPPQLSASAADRRAVVTNFVPVNDVSVTASVALQKRFDALTRAEADVVAAAQAAETSQSTAKERKVALRALAKATTKHDKAHTALIVWGQKAAGDGGGNLGVAVAVLPSRRKRQARTFPSVTPHKASVVLIWPEVDAAPYREALAAVARRVVRIGHSSSLVVMRCVDEAPPPTWIPSADGDQILRVTQRGQLQMLADAFARHQGAAPRVLPFAAVAYGPARLASEAPMPQSCFDPDWIVFRRVGGPLLSVTNAVAVAGALRGAIIAAADRAGELSPAISGHRADGGALQRDHVAFAALPFCGHTFADGSIRGVALILPRDLPQQDRDAVWRTITAWEREAAAEQEDIDLPTLTLRLGRAGVLDIERVGWTQPMRSLRSTTWCHRAIYWRSVTPVALDRHPGNLHDHNPKRRVAAETKARASIEKAVQRLGLPVPAEIAITATALVQHAPPARAFPFFPAQSRGDKPRRVLVHVALRFDHPVAGPMLLGAGRYLGLGLMRPMGEA